MHYALGRQLAMTHKAVRAEFEARLAAVGGSLSTFIVLRSAEDLGLSQREIAERIGVEGPTLVRHLDRLEKEGLIQRQRDAADRRVTRILVTKAGEEHHRRLAEVAADMEGQLRALLGGERYEHLVDELEHVLGDVAQLTADRKAGERTTHANTVS
ncbi:MAG TPA: MarR family transcriptional regulator [Actinomycetota bacterium]|nr:MarR family transcriptional regulator [Actinomycetota bacterium]